MRVTLSAATVNKVRRHCLALLRWAVEIGEIEKVPSWKPDAELRRAPHAFLVGEFSRVLSAAQRRPGYVDGIPAGWWWESLLLSLWYTGSRITAILQVRWDDVLKDGFYLRAEYQKQKADQLFVVGADCLRAIERIRTPERELVWPWPHSQKALYRHFASIAKTAGVPVSRDTGGLFHRIRRSTASYIRAAGGDATSQLGHSCSSVTARYYDPRIVGAHDATAAMPSLTGKRAVL
jgi:integrase